MFFDPLLHPAGWLGRRRRYICRTTPATGDRKDDSTDGHPECRENQRDGDPLLLKEGTEPFAEHLVSSEQSLERLADSAYLRPESSSVHREGFELSFSFTLKLTDSVSNPLQIAGVVRFRQFSALQGQMFLFWTASPGCSPIHLGHQLSQFLTY